jgi:hypothetical protein
MLAFEELSHGGCRWPVADCGIGGEKGQFLFCGDAISERYIAPGVPCSYCATHAGMAYEPSRPAKRTIAKLEAAEERRQELILIVAAAR